MRYKIFLTVFFVLFYGSSYSAPGADWILATGNAQFEGRAGTLLLPYNGRMYLIAGTTGAALRDVWSSSDGVNWVQETNSAFSSTRAYHTGVVYNGKMWVMSGVTGSYDDDVWSSDNGSTWVLETSAAGFPERAGAKAVVHNGKMWIIAGRDNSNAYLNDVWYSTNGIDWTAATRNAQFPPRWQHEALVFNNKIYVIAGTNSSLLNDVWSSSDGIFWTQETPAAAFEARRGMGAVVYYDGAGMKMWIYGGLGASFYNDVWYSSNGITWIQQTASAGFSPRLLGGACVFNNSMWMVAGNTGSNMNDAWYSGNVMQPSETVTATFTFTPTPTATFYACSDGQAFGAFSTADYDEDLNGAYVAASRYQLHEDGYINELSAYINSSSGGTIRLALYSDQGGVPGILLFQSPQKPCVPGWNNIPLNTQYAVEKDYYWIAVQVSSSGDSMLDYDPTASIQGYLAPFLEAPFPAMFPSGNLNTKGYSVRASYCPQNKWVGYRTAFENGRLARLDGAGKKIAMRFTQTESKTISSIYTYVNALSSSPQYRVGIQAASGNFPSGTFLTSGLITPYAAGWIACTVTNYTLSPGDYFVVIEPNNTPTASLYCEWKEGNIPGWKIRPTDNYYDPEFYAFSNLGAGWNPDSSHPLVALKYSDGTVTGNPYHANGALALHNNNTPGDTSDDRFAMQVFVPGPGGWKVDKLGAYVYASTNAPGGTLDYYIYDEAAKVTMTSGVLAGVSNAPVATTGTWVETTLASQLSLAEGQVYKVFLSSPNSPSTNRWHLLCGQTLSGSADLQKATFMGEASYAGFSTNNNLSYTNYLNYDAWIRFRFNGPAVAPTFTFTVTPTITLTPSFTATGTFTRTATSTLTRTNTPSFTATMTVTDTITETVTQTSTNTATQSVSPTVTATVSHTITQTITGTSTQSTTPTMTATETASRTVTPTGTPSLTPSFTATVTLTSTETELPTNTNTPTYTNTFTYTYTQTETKTPTWTPTNTSTNTQTMTFTHTQTNTFTHTNTQTYTSTNTYTSTHTFTASHTFTATPTFTQSHTPAISNVLDNNIIDASKGIPLKIKVKLDTAGTVRVRVKVLTLTGQVVRKIETNISDAGWNEIIWDLKNEAGKKPGKGFYIVLIEVNGKIEQRKIYIK